MTARYADVASALSMPLYVDGACAVARVPCWRVKVRLAMSVHHELYGSHESHERMNSPWKGVGEEFGIIRVEVFSWNSTLR